MADIAAILRHSFNVQSFWTLGNSSCLYRPSRGRSLSSFHSIGLIWSSGCSGLFPFTRRTSNVLYARAHALPFAPPLRPWRSRRANVICRRKMHVFAQDRVRVTFPKITITLRFPADRPVKAAPVDFWGKDNYRAVKRLFGFLRNFVRYEYTLLYIFYVYVHAYACTFIHIYILLCRPNGTIIFVEKDPFPFA